MTVTRRTVLTAGGAGALVAGLGAGLFRVAEGAEQPLAAAGGTGSADLAATPPPVAGTTTIDERILPGENIGRGYRRLVVTRGEPRVVRTELTTGLTTVTYAFASFTNLSDLHIVDDQSTARVEFLDRLSNRGAPHLGSYPFESAYRPHEFLSTHLTNAMCSAIRNVGRGPRTNLPLTHAIITGDMIDNCQYNETRWYIDLLDGGRTIVPNSGHPSVDESVSAAPHDAAYWNPESSDPDDYKAQGFPQWPGLLPASRRTYTSVGLGLPWYPAYGNHDGEIQGEASRDPSFLSSEWIQQLYTGDPHDLAVGGDKIVRSTAGFPDLYDDFKDDQSKKLDVVKHLVWRHVTPDEKRRLLTRGEFIEEHFTTTQRPAGHGFTRGSKKAYYVVPSTPSELVHYIALDSVNVNGGASGYIEDEQFAWLENVLKANSSRYLSDESTPRIVTQAVADKLFVVFCHHPIDHLDNRTGNWRIDGNNHPTLLGKYGPDLERLLLRFPNVIMLATGHTHANKITPFARPSGWPVRGGFWQVTSPAHIDWPIQSRIIEIGSGGGTISIFTTMVDIDAPVINGGSLATPAALAGVGRELAANDPQPRATDERHEDPETLLRMGAPADRNTQLLVPAPFTLPDPVQFGPSIALARGNGNRLELFGTDSADGIFHGAEPSAGAGVSGWTKFDGSLRTIAAAANADGRMEVLGVNVQQQLWRRRQTAPGRTDSWTGWEFVDSGFTGVAATRNADGRLTVFGCHPNGSGLRWSNQTAANTNTWTAWSTRSGSIVQVAAETGGDGLITLFVRSGDGSTWFSHQTVANANTYFEWTKFASEKNLKSIALGRGANGQVIAFAVTGDGALLSGIVPAHGAGSGSWQPVDEHDSVARRTKGTHLAIARDATDRLWLFAVLADGSVVRRRQETPDTALWLPYSAYGVAVRPNVPEHPAATVVVPNVIQTDFQDAMNVIRDAGLAVGNVTTTRVYTDDAVNKVTFQTPAGGTTVDQGTAVGLIVGVGGSGGGDGGGDDPPPPPDCAVACE